MPPFLMNEKLRALIDEVAKKSFVADYSPSDAEVLGIIVAHAFEWDGQQIAEVAYNAFEDANFHSLNKDFEVLAKKHGLVVA